MGEALTPARATAPGAERVEAAIRRRLDEGRRALIPFLTAGDPSEEESFERLAACADAGADILEVGLPFSDPVADGPTLQAAATRALRAGGGTAMTLRLVERLRGRWPDLPVVVLTYLNPVLRPGVEAFARRAAAAGVDALLVPDLSLEEAAPVREAAHAAGLGVLPFAAPTSGDERLRRMAQVAEGFVYCVARLGVTGANPEMAASAAAVVGRVRAVTAVPCAIGFGVGTPRAAGAAARVADGVIVGSALAAGASGDGPPSAAAIADLLAAMRQAMDSETFAQREGS
jgi:tryptophan synthase alpha chain